MTTDAQMPELLPCPFCGSGPAVSIQNASFSGVEPLCWHGLHFVNCGTCGVEGAKDEDRAAAIAAWNRRADICASGQVRALAFIEAARFIEEMEQVDPPEPMSADMLKAVAGSGLREMAKRIAALTPAPQAEVATPTAQEAVPAWQVKPLHFDWHPRDRGNPSEWGADTDDYSAYVLISYKEGHDPSTGIGTWNGVANHKGQSGFPTKEAAMRYCEDTIREDAERAIKNALRWIAHPPQPSVSVAEAGYNDVIHALLKQHETEMRSKGRNPIDYTTKWSLADDAVAALRALKGGA